MISIGLRILVKLKVEISGALGKYWLDNAQKEVEKAVAMAERDATVEDDGAIKWTRAGRYLPDDFCEKLEYAGYNFNREATAVKRDKELSGFTREYRKREITGKEIFEARAAFGSGVKIVDVISGKSFTT